MDHHVTISAKGGRICVKRHDLAGWTIIDERLFDSGDTAGIAEHCGADEELVKAALRQTSGAMVHLNTFVPAEPNDDDQGDDQDHRIVHGEYLTKRDDRDGRTNDLVGDHARADDTEHSVTGE